MHERPLSLAAPGPTQSAYQTLNEKIFTGERAFSLSPASFYIVPGESFIRSSDFLLRLNFPHTEEEDSLCSALV